jgi:hypothetical protein
MDRESVLAWRMIRQGLTEPVGGEKEFIELVRALQPVSPVAMTMPGSPPRLVHRTTFGDDEIAEGMRECRALVKGRFWGGNIGYVLAEDLELYATAFRKELERLNPLQEQVYQALWSAGPLTPRQLKEETGLLNKQIMPALHRLQKAFMVYEAQEDSSWERGWSLFEAEWPGVDLKRISWEEAAGEVLVRLLHSQVFASTAQLRDWSQFPVKGLAQALVRLDDGGRVFSCEIEGLGEGWVLQQDRELESCRPAPSVHMLHRADPLVQSHRSSLKEQFAGREVLQYLLIDGALVGAVCGHWRIGPHDVEDIVVGLPEEMREARRKEVIAEVARGYSPPFSRILRFDGRAL